LSHPTPLHPDADLAVVLADLRQNVAAWRDEGMVMRVFRASICLMLLSILDTLIELLADFRAGRLPPLLPALERSNKQAERGTHDQQTTPPPPEPTASADALPPRRSTVRPVRAPLAEAPSGAATDAPARSAARRTAPALHDPRVFLAPRRLPIRHPDHAPRAVAFYPSHVPRRPVAEFGFATTSPTRAHFVTISR
jgi:hypothetical protein